MVLTYVVELYAKEGKEVEEKLKAILTNAAQTYLNDEGTIAWIVAQDPKDPRSWRLIERYESQGSLKIHTKNPLFKTFGPSIKPLISKPPVLQLFNEIDTSAKSRL